MLPVESVSVVLKRVVSPTPRLALPGVTTTVCTGTGVCVTVTAAVSARDASTGSPPPLKKRRRGRVQRWRPGEQGGDPAVAPWLCVAVFRRVCSEQQGRKWVKRRDPVVTGVTRVRGRL